MQTKNEVLVNAEHRQPVLVQHFQNVIENNELAHAYLFTGATGSGKEELAMWIAMRLFCRNVQDGQPCGVCDECTRIAAHEHPDVLIVEPDGNSIKVDQVRFLKAEFTKSGVEGNQKIFIIAGAETMTASAANSLLKFLEEPSGSINAFLLASNPNLLLPTVISRTQEVEMQPLAAGELQQQFIDAGVPQHLLPLVTRLTHSPAEATDWLTDDWLGQAATSMWQWLSQLLKPDLMAFPTVATALMPLAKDRSRQRTLLDIMVAGLRDALLENIHEENFTASFPSHSKEVTDLTNGYTKNQLVEITDLGLQSKQLLERNVSFQNVMESLTLKVFDVLSPSK
ncbi:DNA polymerase III subunit delta' [Furfurilactobacillus siliginis]|uniref:DNA polymerase III subunit delta n=1 Tax=Furfurilactobacillus siliginis TaxID=348151 RepID=A0A0R2LBB5_9LACO|nr:DNA polymerase III subunit delta' [Furfurilactobacillus siliginis]KRN96572.1 DNA polymerase III subunit delta [Furfurilactobacillus siliginis]GEK29020.1 DNA polymerase III subunit delta' [Furfurilactobacillus siliginis]